MLEIDGSEGGGQLLRTSLALAVITGTPVTVTDIRGSRPEPGLKPQHLTGVQTVARACNGSTKHVELGAETIEFEPGIPTGGCLQARIDTAGSLSLLFDSLLPLAVALDEPLTITATGGTEVLWSPPLSTHQRVKLPLLRECGLQVALERHRTGYYPTGGGKARLYLAPSNLKPLDRSTRGELVGARIDSRQSADLAENDVARRQAGTARAGLAAADVDRLEESVTTAVTDSTGSSLTVALEFEHTRAGFDALGEPGKPAEAVAGEAVETALEFVDGSGAVDVHLADQLLVFLALAGGNITTPELTDHVESSLALLETFGFELDVEKTDDVVTISAPV